MLKEFKEFAMKGNVLDMAIGVIMGAAFGKIVSSLVSDVLMPPIGLLLGGVDFTGLFINLSGTAQPSLVAAKAAGAPTLNYGVFLANHLRFHHHCVCDLHVCQADEPVQERSACDASATTAWADQRRKIIDGDPRRAERPSLAVSGNTQPLCDTVLSLIIQTVIVPK